MQFLIDGSRSRVVYRWQQWPDGVGGQLLTPLTRFRLCSDVYAIDNGAYSGFQETQFVSLLQRNQQHREKALFVAVPDKVGCHRTTLSLYGQFNHLCEGWNKAFVAQDGFDSIPHGVRCLFVGGTTKFKDSDEVLQAVRWAVASGFHVHIGRVNTPRRFIRFLEAGAHTCDGSGVSRFDYMLPKIRDAVYERPC